MHCEAVIQNGGFPTTPQPGSRAMFIEDWNSFYEQAEQLYRNDPLRTRYVMKYKHTSGRLVLKVTDDRVVSLYSTSTWYLCTHDAVLFSLSPQACLHYSGRSAPPCTSMDHCGPERRLFVQCLQYRTDQQADLKKIEKLNNLFFSLMAASSHDAAVGRCCPMKACQAAHCSSMLCAPPLCACQVVRLQNVVMQSLLVKQMARRMRTVTLSWKGREQGQKRPITTAATTEPAAAKRRHSKQGSGQGITGGSRAKDACRVHVSCHCGENLPLGTQL